MACYFPRHYSLDTYNSALSIHRVFAEVPESALGLSRNGKPSTDSEISMAVVDLIPLCLDPHATGGESYFLRVKTAAGKVFINGSTGSSAVRDAYRKCLVRIKAEVDAVTGIDDVGVVHASDPKPDRGDGLMDKTAGLMDWRLRTLVSPSCTIRVDHADNVIYVRGSAPFKDDYKIISSLETDLPMFPHVSRFDMSGVVGAWFDTPKGK